MRAIAYFRMSSDRAGDELGIDRQRQRVRQLAQARGWTIDREFVDNDRSAAGGKAVRPSFDAMLEEVESGRVQVIMAWALDRLLRNRRDQLRLFEACEEHGVRIELIEGSSIDMSTGAGQLVADVLAAQARGEIKIKSSRQREAQEQAASEGRRVGGRRPFGYELDGTTIREAEADAIRQAYRDITAGVPLAEIARTWNAAGLRSGQADSRTWGRKPRVAPTTWKHDTVRLVILNPRYKGRRRHRGEEVADAVWPALVSVELWQAAHDVLRNPARFSGARAEQQLLTGVAICGAEGCGLTVHGGGASHGKPVYRCKSMRHVNRMAWPVDWFVSDVVIARLARPDAVDLLTDKQRPDVGPLRDELTAKRARLDALAVEFADGELTASQLRAATVRLRERIAAIEGKMADAGRVDVLGDLVKAADSGNDDGALSEDEKRDAREQRVRVVWDAMGNGRRRRVIDTLVTVRLHSVGRGTRTFRPETVEITKKESQ